MSSKDVTIHEVVEQARFAEEVELITVPMESGCDEVVLLRTREMPEFAFVMWVTTITSTRGQVVFRMPEGKRSRRFSVVCARCPSGTYGLTGPSHEEERKRWVSEMEERFSKSLVETCRAGGITTIFMRRADSWNAHYGGTDLRVAEAYNHHRVFTRSYLGPFVDDAILFMDVPRSSGMSPSPRR